MTPTPFNVLIADDHPLVLAGIEAALHDLRSVRLVGMACNSTEIVNLLIQDRCDLLVTDFMMPDGKYNDGLTMLAYLRSHFPELPIIVFTALNGISLTDELVKLGIKSIVSKTDDVGHLISAIYAARSGAEYFSPSVDRTIRSLRGGSRNDKLTKSELEVLRLYVSGLSITEIAERLHRTKQTISAQKIKAMQKLGVERDADLYQYVYRSPNKGADLLGIR